LEPRPLLPPRSVPLVWSVPGAPLCAADRVGACWLISLADLPVLHAAPTPYSPPRRLERTLPRPLATGRASRSPSSSRSRTVRLSPRSFPLLRRSSSRPSRSPRVTARRRRTSSTLATSPSTRSGTLPGSCSPSRTRPRSARAPRRSSAPPSPSALPCVLTCRRAAACGPGACPAGRLLAPPSAELPAELSADPSLIWPAHQVDGRPAHDIIEAIDDGSIEAPSE
jgi:hypothetical protein